MLEAKLEKSFWTNLLKLIRATLSLSCLNHEMRGKGVNTMRNCKMKLGNNSKAICTYEGGKMEADVSI